MRRALVVYESLFGHARTIGGAVAAGLAELMPVDAIPVARAPARLDGGVGLLVVGGPNHHSGMPTRESRRQAAREFGARAVDGVGLREWLAAGVLGSDVLAAAFDTRLVRPRAGDHAARTEETLPHGLGFPLVAPAAHFYVASATGPLISGEEERARDWGCALASAILTAAP